MRRRTRRGIGLGLVLLAGTGFVYRRIFTGGILAGRDLYRLFIPDSSFLLHCLRHGTLPLWNPYLRLGQPFAATLQSQAFYPLRWISILVAGPMVGPTVEQILGCVVAGWGIYLLCRALRTSHLAACVAAGAFAFSPILTDLGTAQNVASSAAWTGFLLLAALHAARRPSLRAAAWVALVAALSLLAGSPATLIWQSALVVLLVAGTRRSVRGFAAVVGGLAWAVAISAEVALPALGLASRSVRSAGALQPLRWSNSWAQLLAMVWPFADYPKGAYWGPDQWLIVDTFIGVLVALLALAALRRSGRVWPFAVGGLLFALLSAGSHFPPAAALLTYTPLRYFRYPAKYLVATCFCACVLAGMGLDRAAIWFRRKSHPRWAVATLGTGFAALAVGAPRIGPPLFRAQAAHGFVWILLVVTVMGMVLFALPSSLGRARHVRWVLAIGVALELGAFQVLRVGAGWEQRAALDHPSAFARALPRDFHGRISVGLLPSGDDPHAFIPVNESRDALVPNLFVASRLQAFEGYGPPVPRRFTLLERHRSRGLYDLAGVAYYVRRHGPPFPDLTAVSRLPSGVTLYRSTTAFPRAFLVHEARVVTDEVAFARISAPGALARKTVFLAKGEPLDAPRCQGDTAGPPQESASSVEVKLHACGPAYLVLTDSFAPGWRATVDGKPASLQRADGAFRAVRVGPGDHDVVMRYRPPGFVWGAVIGILALLGAIVAVVRT